MTNKLDEHTINFYSKHCTREEFTELMQDNDKCPDSIGIEREYHCCCKDCDYCWEESLKGITFLGDNQQEVLIENDKGGIFYAKDLH